MIYYLRLFVTSLLLIAGCIHICNAQSLPHEDISHQVAAAVQAAKQNDLGPAFSLQNEKFLPYIEGYVHDPNPVVQEAILVIASGVHTGQAVKILAELVSNQDIRRQAIRALYEYYDRPLIVNGGGPILKQELLAMLEQKTSFMPTKSVLLLACFPPDSDTILRLKSLNNAKSAVQDAQYSDNLLALNLTLAELGDPDALKTIEQTINQGKVSDLDFILKSLKFIDSAVIEARLVPLLKDSRNTADREIVVSEPPMVLVPQGQSSEEYLKLHPIQTQANLAEQVTIYRVCDVALYNLMKKGDIASNDASAEMTSQFSTLRRYKDSELNSAYLRLSHQTHQ